MSEQTESESPPEETVGETPKGGRSKRTWRRRIRRARRWLLRAVAVVVLAALAAVLVICHIPFSSDALDRLIRDRFAAATDLQVTFQQATFHLARGRLDLTNVRISDPVAPDHVLQTDTVRLRWAWQPLRPTSPARITAVEIQAPAPQKVYWSETDHQFRFDRGLDNLRSMLHRAGRREHVSPGPEETQPLELTVTALDFYVQTGSPEAPGPRIAGLADTTVSFRRERDGYWRLRLNAALAGPAPLPQFSVTVRPRLEKGALGLEARWDAFDLSRRLHLSHLPRERRVPAARLAAAIEMPGTDGRVHLRAARLETLDSRLRLRASAGVAPPYPFQIHADVQRFAPEAINWILASRAPGMLCLPVRSGRFEGAFDIDGDAQTGPRWNTASASLVARNLTIHCEQAPAALGPLEFDARLTSGVLDLSKVSLTIGQSRLQGRGRLKDLFDTPETPRDLLVFWTADARLGEILKYLPETTRAPLEAWQPQGAAWGSGTLSAHVSPQQWEQTLRELRSNGDRLKPLLRAIQIDGQARLDGVSIEMPRIQAPVRDLAGRISVANDAIAFTQVEGRFLGSRVRLSGQIIGEPLVVNDPQLRIDIDGRLDLGRVSQWVSPKQRGALEDLGIGGTVAVDLFARGPLEHPSEIAVEGTAQGRNLETRLRLHRIHGNVKNGAVNLRIAPDAVTIESASGKIDSIDWTTSGVLTRQSLRLGVGTNGKLETYQKVFGHIPGDWRLEGPVRAHAQIRADALENGAYPSEGSALSNFVRYLGNNPGGPAWGADFAWHPSGSLIAKGCILREPHMPETITGIAGRFEFDAGGLRTAPAIRAKWGNSETRTSGAVGIDRNRFIEIQFDIHTPHAKADEWFQRWHYHPHRRPSATPRPTPRPDTPHLKGEEEKTPTPKPRIAGLRIAGSIRADNAALHAIETKAASAELRYVLEFRKQHRLWFEAIQAALYDGRLEMQNFMLDAHHRPIEWRVTQAKLINVDCATFLQAVTGKPSHMTGRLTGGLSDLSGQGRDKQTLKGLGEFEILGSSFQENAFFSILAKIVGSRELSRIAETDLEGKFEIGDGLIQIPRLRMRGSLIQMDANGRAGFDGRLDLTVIYRFFGKLRLPVVKTLMGAIEHLGSYFFKVHVGGTIHDPDVKPVPFSIDKIPGFGDPWFEKWRKKAEPETEAKK